jgi:DNA modification methylase
MNQVFFGDCRDTMRRLIANGVKVQTCVTSPPYWGLRDYGVSGQLGLEKTPQEYVDKMVEVFGLVREMLSDDGTLWLNLGDSYTSGGRNSYNINPRPRSSRERGKLQGGTITVDMSTIPRPGIPPGLKPKDLVGIPWRVAFALQAAGWYLRCDIIWHKRNPMPESVTDRPTKSHEYIFLMSKNERYYYDAEAIK